MGRDFAEFVMLKLFCYSVIVGPISGICWFFFESYGEQGVILGALGGALYLHAVTTEDSLSGYRFQRWLIMRHRHYREMLRQRDSN